METYRIKDLTFTYPGQETPVLENISLTVRQGEMIALCGSSGSGKSTLMRNMKSTLMPEGKRSGSIEFCGIQLEKIDHRIDSAKIGYVMQNPENQTVTDKVWHEIAFGLENLGMDTQTIRLRTAEMASFFGIQGWFDKDVNQLSGGQKQILNLASVMVMQPDVLMLDEPTSQLDPIAASEFLKTIKKINSELGTTVVIAEHRLEEVIPAADRVVVMDSGRIICDDRPDRVGLILAEKKHPMFMSMPTPIRIYAMLNSQGYGKEHKCPVDVKEGRGFLMDVLKDRNIEVTSIIEEEKDIERENVIEFKDVWFRYGRDEPDVIKGMSFEIKKGEIFCIVGGNGTGKTTALRLAAGIGKPYRGNVKINGKRLDKYDKKILYNDIVGLIPQNPQTIFVEKNLYLDLMEGLESSDMTAEQKKERIYETVRFMGMTDRLDMHPYDLSGGEQQRAAIAKVLLHDAEIIYMDEPTKGLDNRFKKKLAELMNKLKDNGKTIVIVTHDVEFAAEHADRCAMIFDGKIITEAAPRKFFSGNSFYTTAANRMSRNIFDNAVLAEDVVELTKIALSNDKRKEPPPKVNGNESSVHIDRTLISNDEKPFEKKYIKPVFLDMIMIFLAGATILFGMYVLDNQRYFTVSMLLVIYAMVPFFARFETRSPKARELVILVVMITMAVVGRAMFFMIPSFKPILAIIMISGISLGKESGFLVGAMSAFVSNFIFGQGPWTVWQMLAMALSGYIAGLIFSKRAEKTRIIYISIFGAILVFFLYGGITDLWTILVITDSPQIETAIMVYTAAIPFNIVHAGATGIFLLLLTKPMIDKLNRIKMKYGMKSFR